MCAWDFMPCQRNGSGLLAQQFPDIYDAAYHAAPGHLEMNYILSLIAPIFATFAADSSRCTKMLKLQCSVLCGKGTRRLSAIAANFNPASDFN